MSNTISLGYLAQKSYINDLKNNHPRIISIREGEIGTKDKELYVNNFRRTMKPLLLKYMTKDERYFIPKEYEELILKIYNLVEGGEKTLRKIARKKYVNAKELKKTIDNLEISKEEKEKLLIFFDYEVRLKIDDIKYEIINKLEYSLDYILTPNTDYDSDTRDPQELSIKDKRKSIEEQLSIEDSLEIIDYVNEKYSEFNYNVLCLTNDIAMTRKEEAIETKEPIKEMIKRLSYWE